MAKRSPDQLADASRDASRALAIRHELASIMEDIYDKKRKHMVAAFRRGEATPDLLLGVAAQLAMVEEIGEALDRRIRAGRQATKETVDG